MSMRLNSLRLALCWLPFAASLLMIALPATAFEPNYDESKVPDYRLPDPLVTEDGTAIKTARQWRRLRRPELVKLFETHVYGTAPPACPITARPVSEQVVFDGLATRHEVDVFFGETQDAESMQLLIYVPREAAEPVPAFLGLNFRGNHSIDPDPSITLYPGWVRARRDGTTDGNTSTEKSRGYSADSWPVKQILRRGYGLVTIYYGDIDPDFDDGFHNGIHGQLSPDPGAVPSESRWGSIAAWAYGLSRALDYLEATPSLGIDASRVAVLGHSRLGKTALWAGAADERFAMVISNNSGCGGAALSRRAFGETIERINTSFPHWFCDKFNEYNQNEAACPVDQHQLIALIASRPVYVASATEDRWADPNGEFLAAREADPVYRLLGTDGMGGQSPPQQQPEPDQPIKQGTIGYHLRTGKHQLSRYDWEQYLDFADRHLKGGGASR
jgi:hypothetical protein